MLQSDGLGGGTAELIADGVTSCRYTITENGVVVASWEGPPQPLAMQVPKFVNRWVKFWCEVGSTWPGLSAQFENYFIAVPNGGGGGGGAVAGNGLTIEVLDAGGSVTFTHFHIIGENNTGPIVVTDIDTNTHTSCRADFNRDGFVDFFDLDEFIGCFEGAGCPSGGDADFNRDGFIDFFDVFDFIGAFEAGC